MIEFLFPKRCVFCGKIMNIEEKNSSVCETCQNELLTRYTETTMLRPEFTDGVAAALRYEGKVRSAIIRYKFNGKKSYCLEFSKLMYERLLREYAWEFDSITWVPLGITRKFRRGYNQSELLGRRLAKFLQIPCSETMRKRPFVRRQSSLKGGQRKANVLGAYRLLAGVQVKGKRILLVDDVSTTGATLSECARVLKTAGASAIYCIILAKTAIYK